MSDQPDSGKHYRFSYKGVKLDPYRIADIYGITDHAVFQAIKKLLAAGKRGNKDFRQDLIEARDAITRRLEMLDEDSSETPTLPDQPTKT